ncbi:hypothetical protein BV22DRAFT_1131807 [Leucogyrophana mollusca]|uniref:Uncharacterized protein n=1 Tax=Leucogyrophana mollusca TaxID=85980 RepID=A0ACB8B8R3_9AGAM|nr:hypothetical protein BV22DRAFT_1131807 [Leucogyrophana mollusca]
MASVQTKDHPAPLNLGLDVISSSQPFPSPGSSFLPPPMPGPHEFAVRPPSAGRKMSKKAADDSSVAAGGSNSGNAGTTNNNATTPSGSNPLNGAVSPTRVHMILIRSFLPRFLDSMLNIPRSLLRVLSFQESKTPFTPDNSNGPPSDLLDPRTPIPRSPTSVPHTPTEYTYSSPDRPPRVSSLSYQPDTTGEPLLSPSSPSFTPQIAASHRQSTQSCTSLTSSRPAPPSPAISRRASGLSRTSSRSRSRPVSGISGCASRPASGVLGSRPVSGVRSRPVSGTLAPGASISRTPSGRRSKDIMGMSAVVESKEKEQEKPEEEVLLIKIRDYGFPSADARFTGEGTDVPRPNRPKVLAKRLRLSTASSSSSSSTSSTSDDEDESWDDDNDTSGWGGFKWGFGQLQSSWGAGARTSSGNPTEGEFPSHTDFARNFGNGEDAGGDDGPEELSDEYSEDQYDMDDSEAEPSLLPGLYRAMYAFEPEGTAEMKLEEDQVVRVVGRGGGVGWAVVVKEGITDSGVHALVPESYLELVKLDSGEMDVDTEEDA